MGTPLKGTSCWDLPLKTKMYSDVFIRFCSDVSVLEYFIQLHIFHYSLINT